jgi:glycosidase
LDGVYSHTGSASLYFNREGSFEGLGAYQSEKSPYYSWYTFREFPGDYDSWWGFKTLPTVKKTDPGFVDYIIEAQDSVIAHWLNLGADGFRLDVADELPDVFIAKLKKRLRQLRPDALLMGEVWEDASNKIAYDVRRRYFVDGELDSIMNYPFRKAILDFVRGCDDGSALADTVMTLAENYPAQVLNCNMNHLGTHDTPRILTALVDDFEGDREEMASHRLTPEQRALAVKRLKIASFLQYTLPGSPSIYYGDEAGMEGGKDPFNRRTYPWGAEDTQLQAHFRSLGDLRKRYPALRHGGIRFIHSQGGRIAFARDDIKCYVNLTDTPWAISQKFTVAPMDWMVL